MQPEIILRPFTLDLLTEYAPIAERLSKAKHDVLHADTTTHNGEELQALLERWEDAEHEARDYRRMVTGFLFQALRWAKQDHGGSLDLLLLDELQKQVNDTEREHAQAIARLERRLDEMETKVKKLHRERQYA